jgi:isoquinoline 1-oxidoreductase alpha subunit
VETNMIKFTINGRQATFNGDRQTPALWVIRDELRLTGTKFGCGMGQCGACTIHLNGRAVRSCVTPVSALQDQQLTTIEGLGSEAALTVVQQAWLEHDVAQCGYCQAGQIMAATDLLRNNSEPTDADIDQAMTNLCRCGTYVRMRQAIHHAAALLRAGGEL